MAFIVKEWKARLVEFAGRRKITNVTTGESFIADIERAEGAENEIGDAFSPTNMIDLEQRIAGEFADMNTNFQAGCSKIASAITANGVTTASNASPTTMATNIGNIRSGGTAISSDRIVSGYTAYAGKNLVTGSNQGYAVGYNAGNTAGYNAGNTAGYNSGYAAGRISSNKCSSADFHLGNGMWCAVPLNGTYTNLTVGVSSGSLTRIEDHGTYRILYSDTSVYGNWYLS